MRQHGTHTTLTILNNNRIIIRQELPINRLELRVLNKERTKYSDMATVTGSWIDDPDIADGIIVVTDNYQPGDEPELGK